MEANMTKRERLLRLGGGVFFAILALLNAGNLAILWGFLAVMMVMTAGTGCCMLYRLLGRKSCPVPRKRRS